MLQFADNSSYNMINRLQKHWRNNSKFLIISADADDAEINDSATLSGYRK